MYAAAKYNVASEENRHATVLQTYQCYLRGALGRCQRDMALAERSGFSFGAKLVRGAYIVQERAEAKAEGRVSPIWPTLEATHENYHATVTACLEGFRHGDQVMVATHNT